MLMSAAGRSCHARSDHADSRQRESSSAVMPELLETHIDANPSCGAKTAGGLLGMAAAKIYVSSSGHFPPAPFGGSVDSWHGFVD